MPPTLYWQPMGVGPVRALALDVLTDLDEQLETQAGTVETMGGSMQRQVWGQRRAVRIERVSISEVDTSKDSMRRALRSLEAHLLAGHSVAFAFDSSKVALHFAPSPPRQGGTTVQRGGNVLAYLGASGGLAIGDEVVIEAYTVPRTVEVGVLTAISPAFTLSSGLTYAHTGAIAIRHPRVYPALKLREPGPILQRSGPTLLDLELDLVEDVGELLALRGSGPALATQAAAGASLGARAHLAAVAAITAPDGRT